jgi:hypothetical protein
MNLSDRVRPDVEAAPWVIAEIKKLEAERDAAQSLADHMTELWNEAERERDAALAALAEVKS